MNTIKITLILIAMALGYAEICERISSLIIPEFQIFGLGAFLLLFALCIVGIFTAAFLSSHIIRIILAIIFAISAIPVATYQLIFETHMSYDAYVSMADAAASFGDAFVQHTGSIIIGALQAFLLFLGVSLNHNVKINSRLRYFSILPITSLIIITAMLYVRGGEGSRGLPPSHSGFAYGAFYGVEKLTSGATERQDVKIIRGDNSIPTGDIVIIVDESISGQYLDINDSRGVRSGLSDRSNISIHNFGLAASISNCSAAVNYTLRHGGTRSDYQRINKTMPSIWAYAKAAKYQTIYIDTQRTNRVFDNLMDDKEIENVDNWIQFDDTPIQQRDHAAAEKLAQLLNDDEPQFIYLNKVGAHFPIHDKYPDDYMQYRPALPRGSYLNISDTGNRDGFTGDSKSWRLYRNSYRNTLLWNIGGFFDKLLSASNLDNTTIIYTADHGQNLHEDGEEGVLTHCSPEPKGEEGVVPLVVLTGKDDAQTPGIFNWEQNAKTGHNQSSHYRIFPTLLSLMGYDQKQVKNIYGEDLSAHTPDPFTFNYRFNARLGRNPLWKKIELENIIRPPESDAATSKSR